MLCHLVSRGFKIAHICRLCSNPLFADARSRAYWANYADKLSYFCDEVMPRLERLGLREAPLADTDGI